MDDMEWKLSWRELLAEQAALWRMKRAVEAELEKVTDRMREMVDVRPIGKSEIKSLPAQSG